MGIELVTFPAADGFPLDGLVYAPESERNGKAVLLIHGKTANFYTGPSRFLPRHLTALGWTCLAMNRLAASAARGIMALDPAIERCGTRPVAS